jgi:hypothetical protein
LLFFSAVKPAHTPRERDPHRRQLDCHAVSIRGPLGELVERVSGSIKLKDERDRLI